jgi:tRNA uridine 5-carboxymethylaminomethyl modification enzyme
LNNVKSKKSRIEAWVSRLDSSVNEGATWGDRLRRGTELTSLPPEFLAESAPVRQEVLYRLTYRGYLERELRQIESRRDIECIRIPDSMDYPAIPGLRRESALKLAQIRPDNLGQASRISGVNPADISILMVLIKAGRGLRPPPPPPGESPRDPARC